MASGSGWKFTEEEIRAKLEELGYNNVPDKALREFSKGMKLSIFDTMILVLVV